jgi:hypothetical protein
MAAAPFKATLAFKTRSGGAFSRYCTVSDVNAAYYVFQDGSSDIVMPNEDCKLVDIMLSAAGTDTTTATIYINNAPSPNVVINSANLYSTTVRQLMTTPVYLPGGAKIRLAQVT